MNHKFCSHPQTIFLVSGWNVKPLRYCRDCALSFQNNLNVMSLEKGNFKFPIGSINDKFFLCGSRVAKHFVISLVFAKLRFQYGYECERSNANNYEPKLDKKDK